MKLSVDRAQAAAAMARINGVVLRRTSIPILSHVVLHANGALTLRATDLDRQATIRIPCDGADEAEATVPAAALHDALRQSSAEMADLALDGDRMKLTLGRASFKLPTLPPAEYPLMSSDDLEPWGEVAASDLLALIGATVHAASRDESRFWGNGLRLSSTEGEVTVAATDSKRLAVHRIISALNVKSEATIPTQTIEAIKRLAVAGTVIKLSGSPTLILFEGDDWELISKVIDGQFPDYRRALQHKTIGQFTARSADILAASKRAMIVAQDKERSLRFDLSKGELLISTAEAGAESSEPLEVDYKGADRTFGLPADKLIDAIDAIDSETIHVELTDFSLSLRPTEAATPLCVISLFRTN